MIPDRPTTIMPKTEDTFDSCQKSDQEKHRSNQAHKYHIMALKPLRCFSVNIKTLTKKSVCHIFPINSFKTCAQTADTILVFFANLGMSYKHTNKNSRHIIEIS